MNVQTLHNHPYKIDLILINVGSPTSPFIMRHVHIECETKYLWMISHVQIVSGTISSKISH